MLVPADVWTVAKDEQQGNFVLVRPVGLDVAVPIFIGPLEAHSILIGLGNVKMPRPLTHDLFLSVLESLEASINRVEIVSLKETTFYARLVLDASGSEIAIDARPSDCLALAVRVKCPIFIDESVIDEAGKSVKMMEERRGEILQEEPAATASGEDTAAEPGPAPAQSPVPGAPHLLHAAQLAAMRKKLESALEEENYEEAARLRDRIRELESS